MKKLFSAIFPAVAVMAFLSGCVPSVSPLSEKNELIDSRLNGTWMNGSDEYEVRFLEQENRYQITVAEAEGKKPAYYFMLASKIGNDLYLSVSQDYKAYGDEMSKPDSNLNPFFLIPAWQIYKVALNGDALVLFCMTPEKTCQADGLMDSEAGGEKGIRFFALDSKSLKELVAKDSERLFSPTEKITFTRKAGLKKEEK